MLVTVSSMWFTGRVSGAATVLVLEPSQVTGLVEEVVPPGAFDAEMCVAGVAFETDEPEPPADVEEADVEEADGEGADEEEFAVGVVAAEAPSFFTPVPLLHAVRESAARTTVAAAPARRVREVRRLDMLLCPFDVRVAVVIG
ncbi:hypothetical protein GCM10022403_035760 [Streptomyces coacervatus]|uniref:Secreted protein n=1 Tax=Streptomyces coacervatus TaxID=647381 RepID=A0ABP7HQK7_9ACTN